MAHAIHILNNGQKLWPVDNIMELAKPFSERVQDECLKNAIHSYINM
jgi:hypothetical protein